MVSAELTAQGPTARLVIRPNQSWSWRANLYFLGVLTALSLSIAVSFAWRGYWVILPFSVLEMSALLACIWYCVRQGQRQEVVTLEPERVTIEVGYRGNPPRKTLVRQYDRFYTRFLVEPPTHPWRNKSVHVRCRGEDLRLGRFLNREDIESLIGNLRRGVALMNE